jgi:SAM-dependent methyltransferase
MSDVAQPLSSDGHGPGLSTDFWAETDLVGAYSGTELRPVEAVILDRHRDALSGRVLELGVGAGRVTRHLCAIATEVHGIDVSEAMVEHARAACPEAILVRRDLRDLSAYEPESFDAVLGPFNVLDVLDHDDRLAALAGLGRIVAPDGLLIISSHNRAHARRVVGPGRALVGHARAGRLRSVAAGVIRFPRRVANRRRLRRLERDHPEYSIVNDSAHDYSLLHYYISRDEQERQLAAHGFALVECLDLDAEPVAAGADAQGSSELHYVARRVA